VKIIELFKGADDLLIIPRKAIPFCGGLNETLFLMNIVRWTGHQRDPEGWIYKTQAELEEETYLSPHLQRKARDRFVQNGWLEYRVKPLEHRTYYRLLVEKIERDWADYCMTTCDNVETPPSSSSPAAVNFLISGDLTVDAVNTMGDLQGRPALNPPHTLTCMQPPTQAQGAATPSGSVRQTHQRFKPPTLEEVTDYFAEIGGSINTADEFYDHFTSNGWKVSGKAAMKDWKAAVRNWCRRAVQYQPRNRNRTLQDLAQETLEDLRRGRDALPFISTETWPTGRDVS